MPDIGSPRPPRPELPRAFAPLSRAEDDRPRPVRPAWLAPGRLLRLGLAIGLVLAALVALWRQHAAVVTQDALLSAPVLVLRAPIPGQLSWWAGGPGAAVEAGQLLALIENDDADPGRRQAAEALEARLAAEATAIARQRDSLEALDAALAQRGRQQREEAARLFTLRIEEVAAWRAAAEARAERLRAETRRGQELARGGHQSPQSQERLEAERLAAEREAEALGLRAAALRLKQAAALRGLWLEEGQGGIAYTEQRRDEILLRDADMARQQARVLAEWAMAGAHASEERARHLRAGQASLLAPTPLSIWRMPVEPGARVRAEETVAELLDCRAPVLLMAIPQADVPAVALGAPVRFRLAGEARDREGTAQSWLPEGMAREGGRLALLPSRPAGPSRLLEVALPEPEPGAPCLVGRTARAVIERPRGWWRG